MNEPTSAIDAALQELNHLGRKLRAKKDKQVRGQEELLLAASVSNAWFNTHAPKVRRYRVDLHDIDGMFKRVLMDASRTPARTKLSSLVGKIKDSLIELKVKNAPTFAKPAVDGEELPPAFGKLVQDSVMQKILERRWSECERCVAFGATLASIVMMGGLLEALLLAKINAAGGVTALLSNSKCPKDKKGQPRALNDWSLWDMIEVAHEERWVSIAARTVSHILRDYRNWIHPHKEFSSGTWLTPDDARILWPVAKELSKQLLR